MKLIYVLGPPGAGKTTTMMTLLKNFPQRFNIMVLKYDNVRPELAKIIAAQKVEFQISNDGKTVILGKFPTGMDAKNELSGSDCYTQPQRTRLKAAIQHLDEIGVENVITDGFASINKPFLAQAQKTFSEISVITLTTDYKVCCQRFKKRNVDMWTKLGDKQKVQKYGNMEFGTEYNESSCSYRKTQQVLEVVKTMGTEWKCADSEEAVKLLLKQTVGEAALLSKKRKRRN